MKKILDYLNGLKHLTDISNPRPNCITFKFAKYDEESEDYDLSFYYLITITKVDFGDDAKGYAIIIRTVRDRDNIYVEDEHSLFAMTEDEAIKMLQHIYLDFKVRKL